MLTLVSCCRPLTLVALATALLLAGRPAQAQTPGGVGIGTTSPAPSAALDITSTTQGLLPPRLSLAQRTTLTNSPTAPPVPGLVIYQTDNTPGLYQYDGTAWVLLRADNLGSHTATQNLNLADKLLVGGTAAAPGTSGLSVNSAGRVGVGNPSPDFALDVNSPGYLAGRLSSNSPVGTWLNLANMSAGGGGFQLISTGSGNGEGPNKLLLLPGTGGGVSGGGLTLEGATGNLGLGTSSPTARLDVAGATRLRGLTTAGVVTTDASGNLGSAPAASLGDDLGNHTATQALNLQANALVGTGSSLPSGVKGVGIRADGGLNLGQYTTGNSLYLGYQAGQANTGSNNVFVGYQSGYSNTTGNFNQFNGLQSGYSNTTGYYNLFNGLQSGYSNTTGSGNQFSGYQSGYSNTTGNNNQFSGFQSGYFNTTGNDNQFSGFQSGHLNTTGSGNQFSGLQSGYNNTTGAGNQFSGYRSGYNNTTGNDNQFSGYQSGYSNTTGSYNQFSGYHSGYNNTTGNNNTALGANSGPASGSGGISNATAVGANVSLTQSNTVVLGNGADVGIGTSSPGYKLDVNGGLRCVGAVVTTSDARLKQQVRPLGQALAGVLALRGVRYTFRQAAFPALALPAGEQVGLLAQEVEKVYPELVSTDAQGYKAVNYAQLTPVLIEALKELAAQNEALRQQATRTEQRAATAEAATQTFETRLRELEARLGTAAR